ncbi:NADP-dependent oxidoreductase domain-containing protein [Pterulicium gracile]|uniref:NADP-dependent oxidoreductase domain-containing protein n=1 Tax=Pterulicium gracile TaxID=1884261 RepID=A0A5C3QRX5_9AGAR|nr:NADP-dependent oxidoreductase domain-containing protein [Pterula gracilis]
MPASQFVKLSTGAQMPTVGLGTWKSAPGEVESAVEIALKNGYKHVDTATAYGNEKEVGEGIKRSGVPREEIFLTTKLDNFDQADPQKALEFSLKALDTTYLDLWLMHWPAPMLRKDGKQLADKSLNWLDTWKGMEKVYKAHPDKVKAIGVSNVSQEFMKQLLAIATVVPAVNQIELHPSCTGTEEVEFCKGKGIVITAYSPLGSDNSPLLQNEVVGGLAKKYNVSPANILISLQANKINTSVLTKSVKEHRIKENFKIIDLEDEDIAALEAIDKTAHFRACSPDWTGWGSLGFSDMKKKLGEA